MKFDLSLFKTILFSLGVVSFVIGVYQTVVSGNLMANYWIFMISMCCWLPLRYWRQKEAAAAKVAAQKAAAAAPTPAVRNNKSGRKRR